MSWLANLFGPSKTPEQMMREYKRTLDKTVRELDRERIRLQGQEKALIADMKKMAKNDHMDAVRIMAKDLVRTRGYITKFYRMKAEMQAVSLRLETLKSTQAMTTAMRGVTKCMIGMNQKMNVPEMRRIMMEFEKQNAMMGMKEEIINDTIDDVMDDEGEEEEHIEEMISQVLDEIGLDFSNKVKPHEGAVGTAEAPAAEEDDLQARLDKLRKS
jgi:charged multivesicular body protein 2A